MTDRLVTLTHILHETLSPGDKAIAFTRYTPLPSSVPELESMAVVSLITAMQENFLMSIEHDEISAKVVTSVGTLNDFVDAKLAG